MISDVLHTLTKGLKQLQHNTHFFLVAVLLILLPWLFVYVSQSFFDTAFQNINTNEKRSVSQLHDSIVLLTSGASDSLIQNFLSESVLKNSSLSQAKVIKQDAQKLTVLYSANREELGKEELKSELFFSSLSASGNSLIYDFTFDSLRTWQAFRSFQLDGSNYFIFTEHVFGEIDAVMLARQQQVYLFLPFIFLFLIILAYWLMKQTHWQKEYAGVRQKLNDQMLFTNTIAHELRAPLTAVRGYLSFLLESKNLSDEERAYAENIDISSNRLLALINDFLEVARIQSGKLNLEFKEVDIRTVIQAVHNEFKQLAEEKILDLRAELPQKPIIASTDPNRLQQVLTNLVSNALKYTDRGSVTISLEQTRLKTIIAIKDTGHGISAEDQKKLFGAFTRVGKADKSSVTGTGLGMWITKQLVELLHGTVAVESIEGIGTHAKLTFDV